MLAVLPWRRMVPFLVRAALPSVLLLGATAIANWHDTYLSVTSQPDSPVINHPTAWTSLAPQMADQNVAAGPFRLATIVLACLCALRGPPPLAGPDEHRPGGPACSGRDWTGRRRPGRRRCSPTCSGGSRSRWRSARSSSR